MKKEGRKFLTRKIIVKVEKPFNWIDAKLKSSNIEIHILPLPWDRCHLDVRLELNAPLENGMKLNGIGHYLITVFKT